MKNKKYLKSILQIGDNDLVGNKFNGHEAHKALIKKGYSSSHLVWNKESNDKNTYVIAGDKSDRNAIRYFTEYVQDLYGLDNIQNPLIYDIMYNKLFLDADIVHLHLLHNGLWDLNLLPLMSKLKPIIWSVHDMWIATGSEDAEIRKDYYFPLPKISNTKLNWRLKKDAIDAADLTFLVASRYMENNLRDHSFFKNKEIIYLPYGLDTSKFYRRNRNSVRNYLGIDLSAKVIIFRGDGGEKKGLHFIENVMREIGMKHNIHFLILGGNEVNIPKGVKTTWYGWVKNDELMAKIYSAGDLFLMPSTRESFGMMAIEAMACGTMPIVIDGTSLPETVNHPLCGISTPQNIKMYTKKVEEYLLRVSDRARREDLCIDFVNKKHNLDLHVAELEKIYQYKLDNFNMEKDTRVLLKRIKEMNSTVPTLRSKKDNFFGNKGEYNSKSIFIEMFLTEHLNSKPRELKHSINELISENSKLRKEINEIQGSKKWMYATKIAGIISNLKMTKNNKG